MYKKSLIEYYMYDTSLNRFFGIYYSCHTVYLWLFPISFDLFYDKVFFYCIKSFCHRVEQIFPKLRKSRPWTFFMDLSTAFVFREIILPIDFFLVVADCISVSFSLKSKTEHFLFSLIDILFSLALISKDQPYESD